MDHVQRQQVFVSYLSSCSTARRKHVISLAEAGRVRRLQCTAARVQAEPSIWLTSVSSREESSAKGSFSKSAGASVIAGSSQSLVAVPIQREAELEAVAVELIEATACAKAETAALELAAQEAASHEADERYRLEVAKAHTAALQEAVAVAEDEAEAWRPGSNSAWPERFGALLGSGGASGNCGGAAADGLGAASLPDSALAARRRRSAQATAKLEAHAAALRAQNERLKSRCAGVPVQATDGARVAEANALSRQLRHCLQRAADLQHERQVLESSLAERAKRCRKLEGQLLIRHQRLVGSKMRGDESCDGVSEIKGNAADKRLLAEASEMATCVEQRPRAAIEATE